MAYDLEHFSLKNMVECSSALRSITAGAQDMEDATQKIAQHLYDQLVDNETGERALVLSRVFMTRDFGELEEAARASALSILGDEQASPEMKCLVLHGSAGANPEWNSKQQSENHKAIPLPSESFVNSFPMIRQLVQQLGLDVNTLLRPDPQIIADMAQTTYNVFHVAEAIGSPYVPVQDDFVVPYGVRSVLGFGGMLPSGTLFATILFSKVTLSENVADLFKTLAVSAKLALLPFDGMASRGENSVQHLHGEGRLQWARAEAAGLKDLLAVQERVVREESTRLEQALLELDEQVKVRVHAEEEIRKSRQRYRNLIETSGDWIWEVNEDGIYTYSSPQVRNILGYEPEEVQGKHFSTFMPPGKATRITDSLAEQSSEPTPVAGRENTNLHKDGHRVTVESNAVPFFDAHGVFRGYRGIDRDISQRKNTEEKLQEYASELERANEDVKQFAYIVSHDLRVPLVNLKGFSSELRFSLGELQPIVDIALPHMTSEQGEAANETMKTDIPEALDFIDSAATRMDRLVNALLRLSRMGRKEIRLERVDTGEIVENLGKTLSHQLQEAEADLCVETLPVIVADSTAMEQVFGNIIANAVLYLQPGRPGKIKVDSERNERETTFFIRDNGRGIAEGDMSKVFAPFRRAGREDVKGEGMGMAYVQALVRRHGGRIRCESELDVGTTFIFTIPHREEPETVPDEQKSRAPALADS